MRVTARYSGAADDLRLADEMLAQARTKQLPSTRTEIGAGGELIDREKVGSHLVDTVAHPDYVTAEASSDRLALASQARVEALAKANASGDAPHGEGGSSRRIVDLRAEPEPRRLLHRRIQTCQSPCTAFAHEDLLIRGCRV